MSQKKKKTEKIIPLQFDQNDPDDLFLDELLKDDLMREADELEAQLNNDPKLMGMGASDDLFQKIKEELMEKGAWEEEEKQPNLDDVYAMLPEEDLQALEMGRRMVKEQEEQQEKQQQRRRRRNKVMKRMTGVAAALVVVFGLSMSSDANRRLVSETWDTIVANLGMRMEADYVDEENIVRTRDKQEMEDFHKAGQILGIAEIDLKYLPSEMKYMKYQVDEISGKATFFYTYRDGIFQISIMKKSGEGVRYYTLDENTELTITYTTNQEIEAKLGMTDSENGMYIAQLQYKGGNYVLNGIISLEEMEKIVKNIYFL